MPLTVCDPGAESGCQSLFALLVCNEAGVAFEPSPCPEGQLCINDACTEALCVPGETKCQDNLTVRRCTEDGGDWVFDETCPDGKVCSIAARVGGCEVQVKGPSYIGCTYWTLDLDQHHVTIIRPAGVAVSVDILPVPDASFSPIGAGSWELAYIDLEAGMRRVEAAAPIGVYAYGYAGAVSYGYPDGLNLDP